MTTITKERLLTIKQWRETYGPGSNVVLPAEEAEELARIALTSLEAEAVCVIDQSNLDYLEAGYDADVWPVSRAEMADVFLYRAVPPVPVVPTFDEWLEIRGNKPLGWVKDAMRESYDACRAAMLHGAEPVSQTYRLPQTQFEQVADLYEMQFDDGRTCAFHTDAQKAAQWLQACDGNRVQEYVKLERLQNELSCNSPVTPDGLSTVCAEAYQVVGVMADALGVFGDAAVQKVLDNLSQQKLVHRDVLPFSLSATTDGWISCSEQMPAQDDWILIYSKHGEYMAGQVQGEYVELSDGTLSWLGNALFWMPLPEPPQEVNQ